MGLDGLDTREGCGGGRGRGVGVVVVVVVVRNISGVQYLISRNSQHHRCIGSVRSSQVQRANG